MDIWKLNSIAYFSCTISAHQRIRCPKICGITHFVDRALHARCDEFLPSRGSAHVFRHKGTNYYVIHEIIHRKIFRWIFTALLTSVIVGLRRTLSALSDKRQYVIGIDRYMVGIGVDKFLTGPESPCNAAILHTGTARCLNVHS